jgi:hypothetical protein
MFSVNYFGVVLCSFFSLTLGFLWYERFFNKTFMFLIGIDPNTVKPGPSVVIKSMLVGFISSFLKSVVFYLLL